MKTFKDIVISEDKDSSEYGLTVSGEALTVEIKQAKYNNLMDLTFSGSRMLAKVQSAETLKGEYREEDWNNIDKLYKKLTKKYANDIEKLVNKFETELNKVVIDFEKETGKF